MATLMHYSFTVPLPGLANWSAFLEQPYKFTTGTMGPNVGHYMEGMGLKFIPVIVKCLFGTLSMFGPMPGTSWTYY